MADLGQVSGPEVMFARFQLEAEEGWLECRVEPGQPVLAALSQLVTNPIQFPLTLLAVLPVMTG